MNISNEKAIIICEAILNKDYDKLKFLILANLYNKNDTITFDKEFVMGSVTKSNALQYYAYHNSTIKSAINNAMFDLLHDTIDYFMEYGVYYRLFDNNRYPEDTREYEFYNDSTLSFFISKTKENFVLNIKKLAALFKIIIILYKDEKYVFSYKNEYHEFLNNVIVYISKVNKYKNDLYIDISSNDIDAINKFKNLLYGV